MEERELEALLVSTLGAPETPPPGLDARVRAAAAARRGRRSVSLWWTPLACSAALGIVLCLLGVLLPWPLGALCRLAALGECLATGALTAVGLWKFDLKERGRVLL